MDESPDNSLLLFGKAAPKPRKRAAPNPKPTSNRAPKDVIRYPKEAAPKAKSVTKSRSAASSQPAKRAPKEHIDKDALKAPPKRARLTKRPHTDPRDDFKGEFALSEVERHALLEAARRKYEILEKQTYELAQELQQSEAEVRELKDEKSALLDELLICEGLAVNPYPPFQPRFC